MHRNMDQHLVVFVVATVMVFFMPSVYGTAHLMFEDGAEVDISRAGCGTTKLCVETPMDCDPSRNTTCLFVSFTATPPMAPNGVNLSVEFRGESSGYIALGLARNASEGITEVFLCGNRMNNGRIFFRSMQRNNTNSDNVLTPLERQVRSIRGVVNDTVIRCEFDLPFVNATRRSSHVTTFDLFLGTGTLTGTAPGPVDFSFNGGRLNLADPAANFGNSIQTNVVVPVLLGLCLWLSF